MCKPEKPDHFIIEIPEVENKRVNSKEEKSSKVEEDEQGNKSNSRIKTESNQEILNPIKIINILKAKVESIRSVNNKPKPNSNCKKESVSITWKIEDKINKPEMLAQRSPHKKVEDLNLVIETAIYANQ